MIERLLLAAFLLLCSRAQAEPARTPQDFAYSREIVLPASSSPLASVELPAEVYRASRTPGLLDVMVFNRAGAALPDALQRPAAALAKAQSATAIPFFPIALEQATAPLELALQITRGNDGEVLALRSASTAPQVNRVGAYVLDLRTLAQSTGSERPQLKAARFEWLETPKNLILPLVVESSDDLIRWQALSVDGGILHLEHEGKHIDRDRIEWSPLRADFLRVRPLGQPALPAQLQAVYIEAVASRVAPKLEHVAVSGSVVTGDRPVFRFDMGGPVPVEEVEVELPEDNTVIAAELWSSDQPNAAYTRVGQANFYRVASGKGAEKVLQGPRLQLSAAQTARYYELRIDPTRTRVDNGVPKLVTYHVPERVLFLRRGEPPYTLAYGRHDTRRTRFSPEELSPPNTEAQPGTLLERQLAGGEQLLNPPKAPPPYKTYALWAALVAGVALLAWLSLRLLRDEA